MAVGEEKYPAVDPSGEAPGRDSWRGVNAAQWDGTGRSGRGGGRRQVAAAVYGGGNGSGRPSGAREGSRRGPVLEQ
jgi:hypothetical protein